MIDLGQKQRVLLVGGIKTGNHWCRLVIMNYYNILNNNATETMTFTETNINRIPGVSNKVLREGWQDYYTHKQKTIEFDNNLPLIKYCHSFFYDRVDSELFRSVFDKFAYLIRNPFDQLISWFYYDIKHEELFKVINTINLKELWFFDDFVKQRLQIYIDHVKANLPYADVVLNYDQLRKDPNGFKEVIQLLFDEINEDVFQKAIEMSSFKNAKKMETKIREQKNYSKVQIMARNGRSGQYKEVMKPELIEFIKKRWKEEGLSDKLL